MERDFKGIWIPKELWLSEVLSLQEKVVLVEIRRLDEGKGCDAPNKYFADFLGVSTRRIQQILKKLKDEGYINVVVLRSENNQVESRSILIKQSDWMKGR